MFYIIKPLPARLQESRVLAEDISGECLGQDQPSEDELLLELDLNSPAPHLAQEHQTLYFAHDPSHLTKDGYCGQAWVLPGAMLVFHSRASRAVCMDRPALGSSVVPGAPDRHRRAPLAREVLPVKASGTFHKKNSSP